MNLADHPRQPASSLCFVRIVDVAFETCLAAVDGRWQRDGALRLGPGEVIGPIEPDFDGWRCLLDAHLALRRPHMPRAMKLEITHRYRNPPSTLLELSPWQRVRPTALYFRAGHALLDALVDAVRLERELELLTSAGP